MPPRLLILEDDQRICGLIDPALRDIYRCTFARDLGTALDVLAEDGFEAALVDLSVSDSFGLDTLRRIREVAHGIPLVVMTGAGDEYELMALANGAQTYLTKPFDIDVLRMKLRRAVARGEPYRLMYDANQLMAARLSDAIAERDAAIQRAAEAERVKHPARMTKTAAGILIATIAALATIVVEIVRGLMR